MKKRKAQAGELSSTSSEDSDSDDGDDKAEREAVKAPARVFEACEKPAKSDLTRHPPPAF